MHKSKSYDIAADIIRIIGAIAVVAIHVTDALLILPNHFGGISWWWANLINSTTRIAVPFFIMLSGYLYLNPQKKLDDDFHKKRTSRVMTPFIFWFVFYSFWNQYYHRMKFDVSSLSRNLFTLSIGHLYFLIIILILYLVTPYIKKNIEKRNTKNTVKIIITILTLGITITIISYMDKKLIILKNIVTLPFFFLGYYLFGAMVRKARITQKYLYILFSLFILSTAFTTILVYLNMKDKIIFIQNHGQYFHESFSPLIIMMSLSSFSIIISLRRFFEVKMNRLGGFLKQLSSATFIVYLIHPLVIDLINTYFHMNIHEMHNALWFWISIKIFIVFAVSTILALGYHLASCFIL